MALNKKTLMVLVLVLVCLPPLVHAQTWPNEPSGGTVLYDYPFNSRCTGTGVTCEFGGGSIVSDTNNGTNGSPSNVLHYQRQHTFDTTPGAGVNHSQTTFALNNATSVYIGLWWKKSSPFVGWDDGFCFNKVGLIWNDSGIGPLGKFYNIEMSGADAPGSCPSGAKMFGGLNYDPLVNTQTGAGGNQNLFTSVSIPSGVWNRIEVCHIKSTDHNTPNGVYRTWVNGVQAHNITNMRVPGPFTRWQLTPVWDSESADNNTVGLIDFHRFDHVKIRTNFAACVGGGGGGGGGDTTPPSQVTGVSASNVGATGLTLSWSPATDNVGISNYDIERCAGVGCANFVLLSTSFSTSAPISGLTPGTSYSFRLKARDTSANVSVSYSTTFTVVTLAANLPTITSLTPDANGADVTWSGSPASIRVQTETLNLVEPMSAFTGTIQSIAHVQSRSSTGSGSTAVLSYTSNNTAGNLLVLRYRGPAGTTISSVSDTRGNVWGTIPNATGGVAAHQAMRYVPNCAAGSNTVTVTLSGSASSYELDLLEYSGADTVAPLTQSKFNEQANPGTGANAITTGNVTTTNANELVVGAASYAGSASNTVSAGSGYTLRQNASGVSPVQDKILASAGATAATFTTTLASGGTTLADIVRVQSTPSNYVFGTNTSVQSFSSNVTAGNAIILVTEYGMNKTLNSVSGCGTGWARAITAISNNERNDIWYLLNASGGPCTVTATFSAALEYATLSMAEYSGVATSSALDVTASQVQTTPGSGANGITSGTATTTVDKALIVGITNSVEGLGQTVSAGTGFTCVRGLFTLGCGSVDGIYEDKIQATAGSVAATFTGTQANENMLTLMAAFKPAPIGVNEWFLSSVATFKPASSPGTRYNRIWAPGTTFVCMFARDADGNESPNSSDWRCGPVTPASTDTTPPTRTGPSPSGTLASGTTSTVISLSTDEEATCRYSTSAGTAYGSMVNSMTAGPGGLSHSATVGSLVDGNTYTYYVRCQDLALNPNTTDTTISFSVAATPSDTTPPTQVTGLILEAISPTQVRASWAAASDDTAVDRYEVYLRPEASANFTLAATVTTTETIISGLDPGETYQMQVRALDAIGNLGDFSAPQSVATSSDDLTPPDTLVGMVATAVDFQTLDVSWTPGVDNVGVASTSIEMCEGANCSGFELIASALADNSVRVAGLKPATVYRFRGKHADASGNVSLEYSTPVLGITPAVPKGTVMGLCPCRPVR